MDNCLLCGRKLTSKQVSKKNIFCSKACATSYRCAAADPDFMDENITPREIKFYILGLLFSDGNLSIRKRKKVLSIASTDADTIEFLYPYFSDTKRRKIYSQTPKNGNAKTLYSICSTNVFAICKSEKMGITPNKSLTVKFPLLSEGDVAPFLRGFFDGDGCIYISNTHVDKKGETRVYPVISFTTGSADFAAGLSECLTGVGIKNTIVVDKRKAKRIHRTYYVKISSKACVQRFGQLIYNGATIMMKKKYNVYANCFLQDMV